MASRLRVELGQQSWAAYVDGERVRLDTEDVEFLVQNSEGRISVTAPAGSHIGNAIVAGDDVWVTIDGEVFVFNVGPAGRRARAASRDQDAFTPPMSATVVRIAVALGDQVEDGDVLIALEAMKMELPIRAPRKGIVRAILCREGELVQPGQVLLEFE